VALDRGITGRAMRTGQPQRVSDVTQDPDYDLVAPLTRAQVSVPLTRGGQVFGVITLESEHLAAFGPGDLDFVGQIANQVVIALDNSQLFQRITEALRRLQVLLDAMQEAILLIDDQGYIVLANPRVQMLDLDPTQIEGRSLLSASDADEKLRLAAPLIVAQAMGFADVEELRLMLASLAHTTPPSVQYTTISDRNMLRQILPLHEDDQADKVSALLVFYDHTQETELARAREDLSRMIIHDLRSPLAAVTTSLKLMREATPSDAPARPLVDMASSTSQRAIKKLLNRVDSLLDVSKMQSGELALEQGAVKLRPLVVGVCEELRLLADDLDVRLVVDVPEDAPLLWIDADKVERLLLNLVDNALKYTFPETSIHVRLLLTEGQTAPALATLQVIDQGPGIPNEYKSRIFDRYVQVKGRSSVRGGVGLGLAFCKLAVEAHGGRIWIEDNPTGGTIFACTLPLLPAAALE
jgi:signal transduction histidine kinase